MTIPSVYKRKCVLLMSSFANVACVWSALSFLSFASGKHLWISSSTLSQKVISSFVSISISFCAASSSNLSRVRRHSLTSNLTKCTPARSLHAPLAQPFPHTFVCVPYIFALQGPRFMWLPQRSAKQVRGQGYASLLPHRGTIMDCTWSMSQHPGRPYVHALRPVPAI